MNANAYLYHSYSVTGDNTLFLGMPFPTLKLYCYGDTILHTGRYRNCETLFFLGRSIFKDCDTGETFEQLVMSNG